MEVFDEGEDDLMGQAADQALTRQSMVNKKTEQIVDMVDLLLDEGVFAGRNSF
jgi:hypothetical protein